MINGGVSKTIELVFVDENNKEPTDNCDVWEIAYDGIYFNRVRRPRLGKSLISMGARVDWIVACNNPGVYEVNFPSVLILNTLFIFSSFFFHKVYFGK